jgi:hypothetical protein
MLGADYSSGRPGGSALAKAGVEAVGRYAAAGRDKVNISADEVKDLRAHGIDIYIYNEHAAGYMNGGATAAQKYVPGALQVCNDAGLPEGPIFYSVDYDATLGGQPTSSTALANMHALEAFLKEAAKISGSWDLVGVYGGYYVIGWLLDDLPNLKHAVQTSAWSAGHWDSRAFARQDGYNWMINGVNCDHITITSPDEGSLRYRKGTDDMSQADVDAILKDLHKYIDSKLTAVPAAVWSQQLTSNWNGANLSAEDMLARAEQYAIESGYPYDRPKGNARPGTQTHASWLADTVKTIKAQTDTVEASLAALSTAEADDPSLAQITQVLNDKLGGGQGGQLSKQDVLDAVQQVVGGTRFVPEAKTSGQ